MVKSIFGSVENPIYNSMIKIQDDLKNWFATNEPIYTALTTYYKNLYSFIDSDYNVISNWGKNKTWDSVKDNYNFSERDISRKFTNYENIIEFFENNWDYIDKQFSKVELLKEKAYSYSNEQFKKEAKNMDLLQKLLLNAYLK
jgi:hypothetical protein